MSRFISAALILGLLAEAQSVLTIRQLKEFLTSSIQMKQSDKDVAAFLHAVKLSERLDDRTIDQFQGLGTKTLAALHSLRDASRSLPDPAPDAPPPPPAEVIPPPSAAEQSRVIAEARENSLHYSDNLPNYICLQVTKRYYNPRGEEESWIAGDELMERLTYYDHHEEYKMLARNNQVTDTDAEKFGGSLSRGEFGSLLRLLFEPRSATEFKWERWTGLNHRTAYVFAFRVPRETSQYTLHAGKTKGEKAVTVGFSGSVLIDKETHMVMRIYARADNIPKSFPIAAASQQLDYAFQKIGDQEFLLPRTSDMRMKLDARMSTRNVIEFRNYNKYSTDIKIEFDEKPPEDRPAAPK